MLVRPRLPSLFRSVARTFRQPWRPPLTTGRGAGAVTKKDIVRTIAEQLDLPQLRTRELVQRTFDALIETLVRERRVELRNFGVFQIKRREARTARNPRTGEQVTVPAKCVVTFKPGKEMEARVRQLDGLGASAESKPEAPREPDGP
jgi:integration host factor subunit beta